MEEGLKDAMSRSKYVCEVASVVSKQFFFIVPRSRTIPLVHFFDENLQILKVIFCGMDGID